MTYLEVKCAKKGFTMSVGKAPGFSTQGSRAAMECAGFLVGGVTGEVVGIASGIAVSLLLDAGYQQMSSVSVPLVVRVSQLPFMKQLVICGTLIGFGLGARKGVQVADAVADRMYG